MRLRYVSFVAAISLLAPVSCTVVGTKQGAEAAPSSSRGKAKTKMRRSPPKPPPPFGSTDEKLLTEAFKAWRSSESPTLYCPTLGELIAKPEQAKQLSKVGYQLDKPFMATNDTLSLTYTGSIDTLQAVHRGDGPWQVLLGMGSMELVGNNLQIVRSQTSLPSQDFSTLLPPEPGTWLVAKSEQILPGTPERTDASGRIDFVYPSIVRFRR